MENKTFDELKKANQNIQIKQELIMLYERATRNDNVEDCILDCFQNIMKILEKEQK